MKCKLIFQLTFYFSKYYVIGIIERKVWYKPCKHHITRFVYKWNRQNDKWCLTTSQLNTVLQAITVVTYGVIGMGIKSIPWLMATWLNQSGIRTQIPRLSGEHPDKRTCK